MKINSILKSRTSLLITISQYLFCLILLLSTSAWSQDEPPQPILEIGKGILQGETGYAKFTPNGQEIVTSFEENLFWDAATGELLRSVPGGRPIALSLDGENILVGQVQTIELKVIETGEILQTFESPDIITHAAISPDNSKVLIGTWHGLAYLFDVQTGEQIWEKTMSDDGIRAVEFSRNGEFFMIAACNEWYSSGIWIFSAMSLEQIGGRGFGYWLGSATISPDGSSILVWGPVFGAYLFEVESAQLIEYMNIGCINGSISPDGALVILGHWNDDFYYPNQARIIDARTGELQRTLEFDGHSGGTVDFSPDGTKVLTTGGGRVMVWGISDLAQPAGVREWETY